MLLLADGYGKTHPLLWFFQPLQSCNGSKSLLQAVLVYVLTALSLEEAHTYRIKEVNFACKCALSPTMR